MMVGDLQRKRRRWLEILIFQRRESEVTDADFLGGGPGFSTTGRDARLCQSDPTYPRYGTVPP